MSKKIATEAEAFRLIGENDDSNRGCTKDFAEALDLVVKGNYEDRQLVQLEDIGRITKEYEFSLFDYGTDANPGTTSLPYTGADEYFVEIDSRYEEFFNGQSQSFGNLDLSVEVDNHHDEPISGTASFVSKSQDSTGMVKCLFKFRQNSYEFSARSTLNFKQNESGKKLSLDVRIAANPNVG